MYVRWPHWQPVSIQRMLPLWSEEVAIVSESHDRAEVTPVMFHDRFTASKTLKQTIAVYCETNVLITQEFMADDNYSDVEDLEDKLKQFKGQ